MNSAKMTWRQNNVRLKKAAASAEHLVQMFQHLPIDPLAVANTEKPLLRVAFDDFGNAFDGQLEFHRKENRFILFVNTKYDTTDEHHPRTRFSLSHELGHYFLDAHHAYLVQGGSTHGSSSEFQTDQIIEREADAFAAALLMPSKLFSPRLNQAELSWSRIRDLASLSRTSLVSTSIRSVRLSHFPGALIGIRQGQIAWTFISDALISAGCYPLESGRDVVSPSARDQAALFAVGTAADSESDSSIGRWFRTFDRNHLERMHVKEEFVPVPSMATLLCLLTVSEADLFANDNDD